MIPFSIQRGHRLVERGEDREQGLGRETSDVRVKVMEVEGV